jgi:hypothetical protein
MYNFGLETAGDLTYMNVTTYMYGKIQTGE